MCFLLCSLCRMLYREHVLYISDALWDSKFLKHASADAFEAFVGVSREHVRTVIEYVLFLCMQNMFSCAWAAASAVASMCARYICVHGTHVCTVHMCARYTCVHGTRCLSCRQQVGTVI